MGAGAIGPALGGLGSLFGIINGIGQSNQQSAAENQLMQGLQGALGTESGAVNQLMQSYFGNTLPELQGLISKLGPQRQAALAQMFSQQAGASGAAANMENNPVLKALGNLAQQSGKPNANIKAESGIANQLANYNGLTPAQMAYLQTQAGNAAQSAASTMLQHEGSVPNQALLAQQLTDQAGNVGQNAAVQLGAQADQERLAALQGAGGLYGNIAAQQLGQLAQKAGILGTEGQQYLSGQSGAGSLLAGLAAQSGGLSEQDLAAILSGLGQQGQALGYGLQGLGNIAGNESGLLGSIMGAPSASGQIPGYMGGLGQSLMSLFGGFGGGSPGSTVGAGAEGQAGVGATGANGLSGSPWSSLGGLAGLGLGLG